MRYPEFLKDRGTIGFVAPSMGCTTEPYRSAFDNAIKRFHSMGYKTIEGPNCRCDSGIGISNTPKKCAEELNESYASVDSDVLISCGGGELMCEVVPYIDFERVKQSKPNGTWAILTTRISHFWRLLLQIQQVFTDRVRAALAWRCGMSHLPMHLICFVAGSFHLPITLCGRRNR